MPVETLDVSDMLPTRYEPLMNYRFLLAIEGIDSYLVKKAGRPSISIEDKEINYINTTRYVATKGKFEEITVTLGEAIAPSTAQQVLEWVRLHYDSVSGRGGYADFYKRDIQLKMLDPVGNVVQLWDIKGAQIKSVKFSELDYGASELTDCELTLRYDNAVLQF